MILPQLKIIFQDIPKTGSTSIKRFLYKNFRENFNITGVSNPLWLNKACPRHVMPHLKFQSREIAVSAIRHEPLVSRYGNLNDMHDCFIFTIVRDPFTRFKSAFMELVAFSVWDVYKGGSLNRLPNREMGGFMPDTWAINKKVNNIYDEENVLNSQVSLVLNKMKMIHAKGGFRNINLCSVPVHFWPQHYFLDLTIPDPLNILFLSFENLERDFEILKKEMTNFLGIDVTEYKLTQSNPLSQQIFSYFNPQAIDTIDPDMSTKELRESLELMAPPSLNPNKLFVEHFPTYQTFIPEFNRKIKELQYKVTPHLESHRNIIQDLYEEDYRQFGYEQQNIKDIPIS